MINPFVSQYKPRQMSFEDFQYAFVNTLPPAEQRAAYERYVVPESRRVPRESLGGIARLDFKKKHAPLLLTAGSDDHIIPASLNKANYEKYRGSASITDFKEFCYGPHCLGMFRGIRAGTIDGANHRLYQPFAATLRGP